MSSKNILESIVITVDPNLLATSVATFQLKDGNFLHIQADMRGAD